MSKVEKSNSELEYEQIKKKGKKKEFFAVLLTIFSFGSIAIMSFLCYLFTL